MIFLSLFIVTRDILEHDAWKHSSKNLAISFVLGGMLTSSTGSVPECFLGLNMVNPYIVPTSVLVRGCLTFVCFEWIERNYLPRRRSLWEKIFNARSSFQPIFGLLKSLWFFICFMSTLISLLGSHLQIGWSKNCLNGGLQTRKHC